MREVRKILIRCQSRIGVETHILRAPTGNALQIKALSSTPKVNSATRTTQPNTVPCWQASRKKQRSTTSMRCFSTMVNMLRITWMSITPPLLSLTMSWSASLLTHGGAMGWNDAHGLRFRLVGQRNMRLWLYQGHGKRPRASISMSQPANAFQLVPRTPAIC